MGITPSYYQCRAHCADFRIKLSGRSVESPTQSPQACVSSNTRFPDQYGRGDASSSTAMNEPTNVAGEPNTKPSAETDHTQSPFSTDAKYGMENIASLANMPAGQFVLDLIDRARNTMPLNKVSLATEADILKTHLLHDLRKLTESVDQNISIWMLLTTSYPIAKLLMSFGPSNVYTENDRAKILKATAIAVNAVQVLAFNQRGPQDYNPPDGIEVFEEIRRQHPNDEDLTSLVNCALKEVRGYIETEEKARLAEKKVYLSVSDDGYDHCDLSISD
ncbi:hypothetical protein CBS147317_6241 [Penicillium roqueforti]|nr:hypothetical protein LCP963914a_9816 [Penicillium roqueforti]KAI2683291.1 hypothetical protein CBS147355_2431 [Penicillium roqueforti]KAI2701858.1 hypothetical protein CBS147372_4911 [Penicillium roqueforti]KAI2725248.1 hypothetical protein CBS147354_5201 [Penicillium roqueforti]KAI3155193.1 hypothetical protein CBS147317_6241 [Penicillium roqueforti]